jgi:hypothetical protein
MNSSWPEVCEGPLVLQSSFVVQRAESVSLANGKYHQYPYYNTLDAA